MTHGAGRRVALASAVVLTAVGGGILGRAGATRMGVVLLLAVVCAGTVAAAERRAHREATGRLPWRLIAVALILEIGSRVGWYLRPGQGGGLSWPAPWSAGHLLAFGALAAGLLVLPAPSGDRAANKRTAIDAVAISLSVSVCLCSAVLGWADAGAVGGWLAETGLLLTDAALASSALVTLSRARHPGGTPLMTVLPLAAGAVAMAVGDAAVVGIAAIGGRTTSIADAFTVVGMVGVAAAALRSAGEHDEPADMPRRERVAVLASVVPVVLVALTVIGYQTTRPHVAAYQWVALMVLAIVLLGRLVVALLDNLSLARTVEAQVAERTMELVTREQWFRSLVQESSDVVTVVDVEGRISYQSPAVERLFGYHPQGLIGSPLSVLLPEEHGERLREVLKAAVANPRSRQTVEFPLWHRGGYWCATETVVTSLVDDSEIRGVVLTTRDVTERTQLQQRLAHQAYHDTLTGLANRALLHQKLVAAIGADAEAGHAAVLFCDLDGFKAVNDAHGHDTGDTLLTYVAQRIRRCLRPEDLVARFGGDEFIVLMAGPDIRESAVQAARRIAAAMKEPFSLATGEVKIGVSIGLAVSSEEASTPEILLRNADLAMYRAKADRSAPIALFEPSMHEQLVARLEVEEDLRQALIRGQFLLHYQPTVNLETGEITGVEALIRWYRPGRGVMPPDQFIGIAEENGAIDEIGQWVIREACRQAVQWQIYTKPGELFTVGVNISGRQIRRSLVDVVRDALEESGLPPGALTLEMTESTLVERADEAVEVLRSLKSAGVQIALDDFGTGYSSLSYLAQFPVDILKIDKSFIMALPGDSERAELIRTIVQLGRSLNLTTIAEGIERAAQCEALREMSCGYGQGYLFARPLAASALTELLRGATMGGVINAFAADADPPEYVPAASA